MPVQDHSQLVVLIIISIILVRVLFVNEYFWHAVTEITKRHWLG